MYMFLSERKRRFYLALPLPQNLSPKKLSFKDKGFLKKNIRNNIQSLTYPLVKQQRILYEKHISRILQNSSSGASRRPLYLENNSKSTGVFPYGIPRHPAKIYLTFWEQSQNYKTLYLSENYISTSMGLDPSLQNRPYIKGYPKSRFLSIPERASLPIEEPEKKDEKIQIYKIDSESRIQDIEESLYVYAQTFKTRFIDNFQTKERIFRDFKKISFVKKSLYNPILSLYFCQKFISPPIFANGKSTSLYCRFLYNLEMIKTNIHPQITRKPYKQAKSFSRLLYERKKIRLFYGNLAQKDLRILSKKAKKQGDFEDSIQVLLESRVDVCIQRAGFAKTFANARQLIRQGILYVNGKKLCSCKYICKAGDVLTIGVKTNTSDILQRGYEDSSKLLYKLYLYQKQKKKRTKIKMYNSLSPYGSGGNLKNTNQRPQNPVFLGSFSRAHFLYKNVCQNKDIQVLSQRSVKNTGLSTGKYPDLPNFPNFFLNSPNSLLYNLRFSKEKIKDPDFPYSCTAAEQRQIINVYIANFLRSKLAVRKACKRAVNQQSIFLPTIRNIQNANCAIYWGQKPLHLEISHKTTSFIYLYKPQKVISPICIDFYAFKSKI